MNRLPLVKVRLGVFTLLIASVGSSAAPPDTEAQDLLVNAETYLQKQDWGRAEQAAQQALRRNPRLVGALVILALVDTNQSQLQKAEQHLRAAVSLRPKDARVHSYLGSTLLRQQRYQEAESEFESVLKLDPGNSVAEYNLGLSELVGGKPAAAKGRFRQVSEAHPSDVPALLGLLECDLLLKQKDEVDSTLRGIDKLLPPGDPQRLLVATVLTNYGEFESAIATLEKLHFEKPHQFEVVYGLALAYFRAGHTASAAERAQEAIDIKSDAAAFNLFAAIQEKQNRHAEAMMHFAKAAELEPGNEDYRIDYASAVLEHGKPQQALALWAAACHDFPGSWRMFVGSGAALFLTGDNGEAVSRLLKAVELNSDAQKAYALLAQLYEFAPGQRAEIKQAISQNVLRNPGSALAFFYYGRVQYIDAKALTVADFTSARMNLERALAIDSHLAEASLQLGTIAQEEGRLRESMKLLKQAIRDNPNLPEAHYRLGVVYRKSDMLDQSRDELALFEKLKADNADATHQTLMQLRDEHTVR
jgi:tetratricopeptide (TPR) repeat protein